MESTQGVNFKIETSNGKKKLVYHDRIVQLARNGFRKVPTVQVQLWQMRKMKIQTDFYDSDSDTSVNESHVNDFESQVALEDQEGKAHRKVRPRR